MTDDPDPDQADASSDEPADGQVDPFADDSEAQQSDQFADQPPAGPQADHPPADPQADGPQARPSPSVTDGRSVDVRRALAYGAIALLAVFALVAAFRFYVAMGNVIGTWVAPEYHSLFQAVFNLAILLFAAGGIGFQLRRMGE